jgi:hypothetical protein
VMGAFPRLSGEGVALSDRFRVFWLTIHVTVKALLRVGRNV